MRRPSQKVGERSKKDEERKDIQNIHRNLRKTQINTTWSLSLLTGKEAV